MRKIITLIFIGLMVISCGSTKEVEAQKPVVDERLPQRETSDRPKRKSSVDPEQLAAQLGLSDEKTEEFVDMWNSTGERMRKVRSDYKDGDKEIMFDKMREVKEERDLGIQTILSDSQLAMFYDIMARNRSRMPGNMRRKKGN